MNEFELEPFHRNVPDDDLISDLARVANEIGDQKVSFRKYNDLGKYSSSTISTRFGSWQNALRKAGLEAAGKRDIPEEDLFRNLVEIWAKLGKQPKTRDLTPEVSKFHSSTYVYRFGSWRSALTRFVNWAENEPLEGETSAPKPTNVRRTTRNINWRLRARVLMRDGATCRLCGATPTDGAKLHVDHIYPWAKGGETVFDNLQILCAQCNIGKSDIVSE